MRIGGGFHMSVLENLMQWCCHRVIGPLALLALAAAPPVGAQWLDWLGTAREVVGGVAGDTPSTGPAGRLGRGLSEAQIAEALKTALADGADLSVRSLAAEGGFLRNPQVRIALPDSVQPIARLLRKAGQGRHVDAFEHSLNQAAEQAVGAAEPILLNAVRGMTLADAGAILNGGDTAATDFLRRSTEATLAKRFRPLVERATARAGVTSYYKQLMQQAKPYLGLVQNLLGDVSAADLDDHVTDRALHGLFTTLAGEERAIRHDPQRWGTDLLRRAFGR